MVYPWIYMVYPHCWICMVYPRIYHTYTIHIPYIFIRTQYVWYIPYIYQAYTKNRGSRWQAEYVTIWIQYYLVLLCTSTYVLPRVRTWYVLFTPCTYQVRTSLIRTYSVRTEYRNHDKSTYLRFKVHTFRVGTSTYRYVPSTYCFATSCTNFLHF